MEPPEHRGILSTGCQTGQMAQQEVGTRMEQPKSPKRIGKGLAMVARGALAVTLCGCATAPVEGPEGGREPISVHVDNMTSRVVTVDLVVGIAGSPGSTSFGNVSRQSERPVTRRVGLVNGQSRRTLTVPWQPSRLAHQLLWLDGVARVATDTETLGPGQHRLGYLVEECLGEHMNACSVTYALHLPPGSEVTLVIDKRHEARLYYQTPEKNP